MSLSYRISVSGSESRVVTVEDGVCQGVEMLDILPRERMGQMLKGELEKRGFQSPEGAPGVVSRSEAGVEVTVDLEKGVVSVRLAHDQEVSVTRERSARVSERNGDEKARAELQEGLRKDIEAAIAKEREGLREEVTARLEKMLPELRKEIDEAVNRVTADALKIRASQLGEIQEVTEDQDGSITIKVRT
jgi:hypothetical protein